MSYRYIDTPEQLSALVSFLDQGQVQTWMIDTEFVRVRTYYAKLGLIQMYNGEQGYLVDPLALEMDGFWQALSRHDWVLHAFSEDLEIILRCAGMLGRSVYDTQVGAAFLGEGASMGFQRFVAAELDIDIEKGEARTNWLARPLTQAQLQYAWNDVAYLYPAYLKQIEKLEQSGFLSFAQQECQRLAKDKSRKVVPDLAYIDVKNSWKLKPSELAILKELASWRVVQAQARDLALNNVVHADSLIVLAQAKPRSWSALNNLRLPKHELRIHGQSLLKLVEQGIAVDPKDRPLKIERMVDFPSYKKDLARLREVVTKVAEETGLPEDILGQKKILNGFLLWHWQGRDQEKLPILLSSWRAALFETHLLDF
ncbi:ribonuclease D [Alginatibacterium sediminis]|nr:ribonuclease D [Alginatibacterium sediminis]